MPALNRSTVQIFYKEQIGKWNYWRVRVGKKLTGGKAIIRRFAAYTKAVEWVEGLIEEREKHGSELFSLTHDQLAEARRHSSDWRNTKSL
jgi:hypothetical protein